MRIGANQIRLEHERRNLVGIINRHTDLAQRIHDEPCNGCRRNTRGFGRLEVHDLPESRVAARWPKIVALSASGIFNERTCFTQSIIPMS
jgi:hypothetical protein